MSSSATPGAQNVFSNLPYKLIIAEFVGLETLVCWADDDRRLLETIVKAPDDCIVPDAEGNTVLMLAAKHNKLKVVEYCAETVGVDVSATTNGMDRETALHIAAQNGSIDVVRYLARNERVDVNLALDDSRAGQRRTPLHLAAGLGHAGVVQILGDAGSKL